MDAGTGRTQPAGATTMDALARQGGPRAQPPLDKRPPPPSRRPPAPPVRQPPCQATGGPRDRRRHAPCMDAGTGRTQPAGATTMDALARWGLALLDQHAELVV